MMTAIFNTTFHGKTQTIYYALDKNTPEYIIADLAYKFALMYVQTRAIAETGHKPCGHDFVELLQDMDYNYRIEKEIA